MSVYTLDADGLVVAIDGEPVVPAMRDPFAPVPTKPCHGRNANVCAAEGCFGEACVAPA